MANPTVKAGIAQSANLKAALWVSPDVVGGAGAWDAKAGVRYAPWGTLSSVQLGSSAHYGLSSPGATNCGIDLGLAVDHTTTPFDFTTSAFTLVVCAERNATSGAWRMIENIQEYSPSNGWVFVVDSGYLQLQDAPLSYPGGVIVTNNETAVFAAVYDGATCKLYKNGTQIASGAATGAVSYGATGVGRRASMFNLSQARGLTAAAGKIFGALVYDVALSAAELQTFGTTNGAIVAGSFHDAAFEFASGASSSFSGASGTTFTGTATSGNATSFVAASGSTFSGSASVTAMGVITTPVLKNNTGTVLASETGVIVNIYHATTGALIVQKTGQTSNGSGVVIVSDALIIPATTYAYEVILTGSRRRLPTVSAT